VVSPQRIDGSGELTGWAWTKDNFRISHNTTGLARWIYDWELAASPARILLPSTAAGGRGQIENVGIF